MKQNDIYTTTAMMKKALDRLYDIECSWHTSHIDRMTMAMQLIHVKDKLDLDKLLSFDDVNFMHDMRGINQHVLPTEVDFTDCFSPRCETCDR